MKVIININSGRVLEIENYTLGKVIITDKNLIDKFVIDDPFCVNAKQLIQAIKTAMM